MNKLRLIAAVVFANIIMMVSTQMSYGQALQDATPNARVLALGGDSRILVSDYENIFFYPSQVTQFPKIMYAEVNDTYGGFTLDLPVGVLGVILNKPLNGTTTVSNTIGLLDDGGISFRDNNGLLITPKSSIDLTYGIKLAGLSLGAQFGVAGDAAKIDSLEISSKVWHFRGGASLDIGSFVVDVSGGLELLGYKHERIQAAGTNSFIVEGNGGIGINLQGRMIVPFGSNTKLIPTITFVQSGIGVSTTGPGPIKETVFESSSLNMNVGVGLNHAYDENTTVLAGVFIGKFSQSTKDTTGGSTSEVTTSINSFPRVIIGIESKVKSWLTLRTSINRNLGGTGITAKFAGKDQEFKDRGEAYNLAIGSGIIYKNITLDGLFVNTFFSTGPGLLSQVPNNIFSRATISYSF